MTIILIHYSLVSFWYGTVSIFQLKSQLSLYIPVIGLNRFCMLLFMVYGIHIDCLLQELNSDWQRAATSLLVAIGSHLPDLVSYSFSLNYHGCRHFQYHVFLVQQRKEKQGYRSRGRQDKGKYDQKNEALYSL